jgi:hypothetical protein
VVNVNAFAVEVRRLMDILDHGRDYTKNNPGNIELVCFPETIKDKAGNPRPTGKWLWTVKCRHYGGLPECTSPDPETAARALVKKLQSDVQAMIAKKRQELDEIEQANARGLKLVEPN